MVSNAAPIQRARVMVVDDDPVAAEALADMLRRDGHDARTARDGEHALALLNEPGDAGDFALVVTDLNMPHCDGLELLRRLRRQHPSVVPIVLTGYGKLASAVEAIKLGAVDFLTKPVVADDLRLSVDKAINQHALLAENGKLRRRLGKHDGLGTLIGTSAAMRRAFDLVQTLGTTDRPVLVTGEAGAGKDAVAHALHRRAVVAAAATGDEAGPLVRLELTGEPDDRDAAELFGYTKGSRPGARHDVLDKLAEAADGTLVISRLDRATPDLQAKLMALVETGVYRPIGAAEDWPCEARLVFTARAEPKAMIEDAGFREDLAYALGPGHIVLPALRARRGDIAALAEHFVEQRCAEQRKQRRLGEDALAAMEGYDWPGNVRELEKAVEHAVLVSPAAVIGAADLPEPVVGGDGADELTMSTASGTLVIPALADGWTPTTLDDVMSQCERQVLRAALDANDWNRSETARQLNINRATLYKKVRAYRLDEPDAA